MIEVGAQQSMAQGLIIVSVVIRVPVKDGHHLGDTRLEIRIGIRIRIRIKSGSRSRNPTHCRKHHQHPGHSGYMRNGSRSE